MKALIILVLAAVPVAADAQSVNVAAVAPGANVVAVTTGVEHGLVAGAAFSHVATLADRPLVLGADLTVDAADARDVRLRAEALAPIACHGAWKLVGGAAAIVRGGHTDVAQMIDVGADVEMLAGHYSPRWFAAAELGFDWAAATHIAHSDAYRMLVYPDARDGWYRNTGGLFRFGVQGGVSLGKSDLVVRAGMLRDDGGNPPLFPMYATLGVDRRW